MSEPTARAGTGCPPAWALQRYAACPEEAEAGTAEHVAVCPRCQDFVAERRAEGAAYMRSPAADALRQRLAQAEGAKAVVVRPRAWAWGGVLAAAAAVAISFSSAGPEQADSDPRAVDGLNPKGMAQLALFVGDEGQAPSELEAPATLLPGTRLQPAFSAPKAGFVALVLTSPAGERVRLYPAGQEQSAPVEAGPSTPLGPSFRLDDEVGRYRVTAYFADESFPTQPLLGAAPERFHGVVLTREFAVQRR